MEYCISAIEPVFPARKLGKDCTSGTQNPCQVVGCGGPMCKNIVGPVGSWWLQMSALCHGKCTRPAADNRCSRMPIGQETKVLKERESRWTKTWWYHFVQSISKCIIHPNTSPNFYHQLFVWRPPQDDDDSHSTCLGRCAALISLMSGIHRSLTGDNIKALAFSRAAGVW